MLLHLGQTDCDVYTMSKVEGLEHAPNIRLSLCGIGRLPQAATGSNKEWQLWVNFVSVSILFHQVVPYGSILNLYNLFHAPFTV